MNTLPPTPRDLQLNPPKVVPVSTSSDAPKSATLPTPLDPQEIYFTQGVLKHAAKIGITLEQMHLALSDPRWINTVRQQPDPANQTATRYRYCGHGAALIVEDDRAIAVIPDDTSYKPRRTSHKKPRRGK